MADQLFLFTHLHKSAGTSLRIHIKKNTPPQQRLNFFPDREGYGIYEFKPDRFSEASQNFCQKLTHKRKERLKFVYGHKLHWGLDRWLLPDNSSTKSFYFTFFREPLKRIISLYNYYRGWYERELPAYKNKRIYHNRLLLDGRCPDFKDWFEKKFMPTKNVLGLATSSEYYQQLGYLEAGKVNPKKIRACLDKFSFIGLTSTFDSDSLYLYHYWGFSKFFKRRNISTKYFTYQRLNQMPKLKTELREQLSDDYLLFEQAKKWRQAWLKSHPKYQSQVNEMKTIKTKKIWWQHLLFDLPHHLHQLSSWLRLKSKIYGGALDQIKLYRAKAADKWRQLAPKFGLAPKPPRP